MDKQKQIEEMANIICEMANIICEMAAKPNTCAECGGRNGGCFSIPKMEKLYDLGYRKIPEGAVVLTMEEFQGYRETQQHVFEDLQRTRKEMAKEIYEWLIENICESEFAVIMTYFRERYGVEVE